IFGATCVFLAPEHPLVDLLAAEADDPDAFRKRVANFKTQDRTARMSGELEKEGFFTGKSVTNPFTNEPVPVWIANFVLGEYGTGAVMAVPAHDQRDFEFAKKFGLPIRVVVHPDPDLRGPHGDVKDAYVDYGRLVDSGEFTGLTSEEAILAMGQSVEA